MNASLIFASLFGMVGIISSVALALQYRQASTISKLRMDVDLLLGPKKESLPPPVPIKEPKQAKRKEVDPNLCPTCAVPLKSYGEVKFCQKCQNWF